MSENFCEGEAQKKSEIDFIKKSAYELLISMTINLYDSDIEEANELLQRFVISQSKS